MSNLDPEVESTLQSVNEWLQRRQARDAALIQSVRTWLQNREADTLKAKEYLIRMGFAKEDVDQMQLSTQHEQLCASQSLVSARLTKIHEIKVDACKKLVVMVILLGVFGGYRSDVGANMFLVAENTEMVLTKLLKEINDNRHILGKLSSMDKENIIFVEREEDFGFLRMDSGGVSKSLVVNVLDSEMLKKAIRMGKQKQIKLYKPSYVDLDVPEINDIEEAVKGSNAILVETELELLVHDILLFLQRRQDQV